MDTVTKEQLFANLTKIMDSQSTVQEIVMKGYVSHAFGVLVFLTLAIVAYIIGMKLWKSGRKIRSDLTEAGKAPSRDPFVEEAFGCVGFFFTIAFICGVIYNVSCIVEIIVAPNVYVINTICAGCLPTL